MCILAKTVPKETRFRLMPLAFGGIAAGVLIGYPLGGALYQFLGKTAPFLVISGVITINIGKQITTTNSVSYSVTSEEQHTSLMFCSFAMDFSC